MPAHVAASVGSPDDKAFSSDQHVPTTHEHYVKVVKHEVVPPKSWGIPKPVQVLSLLAILVQKYQF